MRNKKRVDWLLLVFASLLFWLSISRPAFSVSSLDACASQPSCAAAFGTSTAVRTELTKTAVTATGKSFGWSTLSTSGTGNLSSIGNLIFGIGAAAHVYYELTKEQSEALQQEAADNFCQANPGSGVCGGWSNTKIFSPSTSSSVSEGVANEFINTFTGSFTIDGNTINYQTSYFYERVGVIDDNGSVSPTASFSDVRFTDIIFTNSGKPTVILQFYREQLEWTQWSDQVRTQAIQQYLSDDQIVQAYQPKEIGNQIPAPENVQPGDTYEVTIEAPTLTEANTIEPSSTIATEKRTTGTETGGDTGSGGGGSGTGGDTGGDTGTDTSTGGKTTTFTSPQGDTLTLTLRGDGEPESVEEPPLEPPTYETIEPTQFDSPNFLEHGVTVMSNKFPFDIFGSSVNTDELITECPNYTFFNKTYELCPISDLLSLIKFPIIISFLIYSVQSL